MGGFAGGVGGQGEGAVGAPGRDRRSARERVVPAFAAGDEEEERGLAVVHRRRAFEDEFAFGSVTPGEHHLDRVAGRHRPFEHVQHGDRVVGVGDRRQRVAEGVDARRDARFDRM